MKSKLIPLLLLGCLMYSCQTDEEDTTLPLPLDPLSGLGVHTVQVKIPDGMNLDLQKTKIYSFDLVTELPENGQGKVFNLQNNPGFAYLFDEQENLIMAGLVGPGRSEISPETITEFLLYHGFGIPFMEEEVALKFFQEVRQFPIWEQALNEVRAMLVNDPLMLGKPEISSKINAIINPLSVNFGAGYSRARLGANEPKASDLLIDGQIRSGLQVYQTGLNQFAIDNTSRRRIHGFLYKTGYVDQLGNTQTIHHTVGSSSSIVPDKEIQIPRVNGITGISSTIFEYLTGETEKSFRTTSEAVAIPLTEAEKEAKWQLRLIGVGTDTPGSMNNVEISKLINLQITTLALDFIIPLIADAIAVKGMVSKGTDGPKGEEFLWEALITVVTEYVSKMPEVKEKIDKGDYQEAVRDFFTIGWNQFGSIFMEDLAKIAAETIYNSLPKNVARPKLENMQSSASRKIKIIGAIDLLLKGSDYARMMYDIQSGKDLEVWEIKAKEIEINLEPRESTIEVNTEKKLIAHIKSIVEEGQIIEYHWSTTGKYGLIKDNVGHSGNSFTSSVKEVTYACTAEADPNASNRQDTVSVEIFMRVGQEKYKVGSDLAILKVGDKEVFTVGWEKRVEYRERMGLNNRIIYSMGNGGFVAKIPPRPGAKFFDLVNVRADGSRTPVVRREATDAGLEYRVGVGGLFIFETYSKAELDKKIEEVNQYLDQVSHNYNHLEVTVIR